MVTIKLNFEIDDDDPDDVEITAHGVVMTFGKAGYLVENQRMHLCDIHVEPHARRTGVGTALLQLIFDRAAERGLTEIWGSVVQKDVDAFPGLLEWYKKRHFEILPVDAECGTVPAIAKISCKNPRKGQLADIKPPKIEPLNEYLLLFIAAIAGLLGGVASALLFCAGWWIRRITDGVTGAAWITTPVFIIGVLLAVGLQVAVGKFGEVMIHAPEEAGLENPGAIVFTYFLFAVPTCIYLFEHITRNW